MKRLLDYLRKKIQREDSIFYFLDNGNKIEYEIRNDKNFLYRIEINYEFMKIIQIDSDEGEGIEIFSINIYHFEEDEFLIHDIIEKFIENQIEYFK